MDNLPERKPEDTPLHEQQHFHSSVEQNGIHYHFRTREGFMTQEEEDGLIALMKEDVRKNNRYEPVKEIRPGVYVRDDRCLDIDLPSE